MAALYAGRRYEDFTAKDVARVLALPAPPPPAFQPRAMRYIGQPDYVRPSYARRSPRQPDAEEAHHD